MLYSLFAAEDGHTPLECCVPRTSAPAQWPCQVAAGACLRDGWPVSVKRTRGRCVLIFRFRFRSKPFALCGLESTRWPALAAQSPALNHSHYELHIRSPFGNKRSVTSRPRSAGPSHGISCSPCSFVSRFGTHPGFVRVRCVAGVAQWELRHSVARLTSRAVPKGHPGLDLCPCQSALCRFPFAAVPWFVPAGNICCDIGSHVGDHMCSSMCLLSLLVSPPAL